MYKLTLLTCATLSKYTIVFRDLNMHWNTQKDSFWRPNDPKNNWLIVGKLLGGHLQNRSG